MTLPRHHSILRKTALFIAFVVLAGCADVAHQDRREEQDPLVRRALVKKRSNDVNAAIDLFHQAVERKPQMARPHLELGLLYDGNREDYVRAIYHYQMYLEKRPDAEKRDIVEKLIEKAKISYAASLPHQPSGAIAEIQSLRNESRLLRRRIQELQAELKALRESSASPVPAAGPMVSQGPVRTSPPAAGDSASGRIESYTVQPGDTLSSIAQKMYRDSGRWRDIYDANRGTLPNPQSMRPGQNLIIPRP